MPSIANNIRGLVLAGGKSTRMTTDKGLIPLGDVVWAKRAASHFQELGLPFSISINISQLSSYLKYFASSELVIDSVPFAAGPASGLLSAHLFYPANDLFLLACDMPGVTKEEIEQLLDTKRFFPQYHKYAFRIDGVDQPLCCLYRVPFLNDLIISQKTSGSINKGLKHLLKAEDAKVITSENPRRFININTAIEREEMRIFE